jgi:hypothetical protein
MNFCNKFAPGNPFQPGLLIVDKAKSLPQSGAPKWYFTWVGSFHTRNMTLSQKGEQRTNTLAYYEISLLADVKSFVTFAPVPM